MGAVSAIVMASGGRKESVTGAQAASAATHCRKTRTKHSKTAENTHFPRAYLLAGHTQKRQARSGLERSGVGLCSNPLSDPETGARLLLRASAAKAAVMSDDDYYDDFESDGEAVVSRYTSLRRRFMSFSLHTTPPTASQLPSGTCAVCVCVCVCVCVAAIVCMSAVLCG